KAANCGSCSFCNPALSLVFVFVLDEAEGYETEVFKCLGEDDLIDEEDNEFVGVNIRGELDLAEASKPFAQVFEESAVKFRFLNFVFGPTQHFEQAAGLDGALQQL